MQSKNVTVGGKNFDLSSDQFSHIETLVDLRELDLFNGDQELESQFFNAFYQYKYNSGPKTSAKVMTPATEVVTPPTGGSVPPVK